jgi:tetratricopeptide (TPR) repeat protein
MGNRSVAAAMSVALAAAGCASLGARRTFRCPVQGGPAWHELATAHFVLRTDLDVEDARALLVRLERHRAAIVSALFAEARPPPGRAEVVAFRSWEEYRELAPPGVDAYYLRSAGGPPRIVLSAEMARYQRTLLSHELAHHYLAGAFARQPRWLAEGLACYVESLALEPGAGALIVGRPPPDRLARARRTPVPVAELLVWSGLPAPNMTAHYASSWLLVHYLVHRHGEAFARYQERLARGEDPARAWVAELPEFDPGKPGALEGLDRTLARYARGAVETSSRAAPEPSAGIALEQRMPTAEVHALRLALWPHGPDRGAGALRDEIAEALRESPNHPVALEMRSRVEGDDPLPLARRAVSAHPDDPRGWTFLAGSLEGAAAAAEREAAYRRAADLAPENPAALHNLAADLLEGGRSGEALPLARRAAQLAPWSPPLLRTYAAVLSDLGRCAEAIPVQERAIDVVPEGTGPEVFAALRGDLEKYLAQCGRTAAH